MTTAVRVSLLLLFFLSTLTNLSSALFEDQAGLTDWHRQYIGKVKGAMFYTQKMGRKRVFVSTEKTSSLLLISAMARFFGGMFLGAMILSMGLILL